MGLTLVIAALLIFVAMVYGVFFLIFKLGWVIAGKKTNKWPLILAAVTTVLFLAVSTIAAIVTFNTYLEPIMGLVEKTMQKTELTTGIRPYKDPKYGFTMNLFGGTEVTKWIPINDQLEASLGFDTNYGFLSKKKPNSTIPVPSFGFAVLMYQADTAEDPQTYLQNEVKRFTADKDTHFKFTSQPDYSVPNSVFLEGDNTKPGQENVKIYILSGLQGKTQYLIITLANGNPFYLQQVKEQILSFRLSGFEPVPVKRSPFSMAGKDKAAYISFLETAQ